MLLVVYCIVFGGFLCLLPLAIYLLVLASVNYRRQPTLISGAADFAAALGALSGFLILGGPIVLLGLNAAWRRWMFRGSFASAGEVYQETGWVWLLIWAAYFGTVVSGALWLYRVRRRCSVVFNVEPAAVPPLLKAVAGNLAIPIEFRGAEAALGPASRPSVLNIRIAPVLRSATLDWTDDARRLRPAFEGELRRLLPAQAAPESPVGSWLMAAATCLLVIQFVALALLILLLYYARN